MPALAKSRRRPRRIGATARELALLVGVSVLVFLALLIVGRASAATDVPVVTLDAVTVNDARSP